MTDLNHALIETTRPPIYTSMKYWGKKPHNIWREFMEHYCPPGGTVFDPFTGSGMSALEAFKAGRKAVAFDLNPLSSFMIEVLSSELDEEAFMAAYGAIVAKVEADPVYREHYRTEHEGSPATVCNYRWSGGRVEKMAVETDDGERVMLDADDACASRAASQAMIDVPFWFPDMQLPTTPSVNNGFVRDIGGNGFQHLWTRRNLYVLSKIFDRILGERDADLQKQLLLGFIQTLHLASKMVVPRNEKSNRDFSGSWGRADYMIRRRSMEQNPLMLFQRSCLDKQGVLSALRDAATYLPRRPVLHDVGTNRRISASADINYGIVDVADVGRYVADRSVDFIITDPPYAGLVMYLDLSMVWLSWLSKVDAKYLPDFSSEITVKDGHSRERYRMKLTNAFKRMHAALKDDGKIVITFHHKKIAEWNDFVAAVKLAGFKFEKVTHQYNLRSGESNVSNPYGTSGADFYVRCVKAGADDAPDDVARDLRRFIVQKTVAIIAERNEPTPYEFIFTALIPSLIEAGYMRHSQYKEEIDTVLSGEAGPDKIFSRTPNADSKAGDYWWFNRPAEHINFPDLPLKDRMEESILSLLRRNISVKLDDVLSDLFRAYPDGLTPDPKGVVKILEKFAYKSAGYWKLKDDVRRVATEHTRLLVRLATLGHAMGYHVYVGKRERHEPTDDGGRLRDVADREEIGAVLPGVDARRIERIEMVDQIWIDADGKIAALFEVENSTNFISAIQRGSNLDAAIPKYMVVPDARERELLATRDPLFVDMFRAHGWSYLTYASVTLLSDHRNAAMADLLRESRSLNP
jgi:hypothetical protein